MPVDRRVAEDIVPVYRGAEGVRQWKTSRPSTEELWKTSCPSTEEQWKTSCPSTEERWKTSCPSTEDAAAELVVPVTIDAFKRKL